MLRHINILHHIIGKTVVESKTVSHLKLMFSLFQYLYVYSSMFYVDGYCKYDDMFQNEWNKFHLVATPFCPQKLEQYNLGFPNALSLAPNFFFKVRWYWAINYIDVYNYGLYYFIWIWEMHFIICENKISKTKFFNHNSTVTNKININDCYIL